MLNDTITTAYKSVVAATYHAKSCNFVLNIKMHNYSVLEALTISLNAHCLQNGLIYVNSMYV